MIRQAYQFLRYVANHKEPATSLALFRVLLCASALYSLAIMSDREVFEIAWVRAKDGGLLPLNSRHWIYTVLGGFNARSVNHVYGMCLLFTTCGLLGFGGRLTILCAQQCYVALRNLNENASGGYDSLISLGMLVLACSFSTSTLSLDCRLASGRWWSSKLVSAWPRAVLVFQLLLMYTMTGLQKVGHSWTPMGGYTALHYVLNDPTWLRWELGTLPWLLGPVLRVSTAITWHWEQLSLLLLLHWFFRWRAPDARPSWLSRVFVRWDLRYPWAAIGVALHAGILLLFDVGPFSLVSLAYYVNMWSPAEWQRFYRTLRARLR